MSRKRTLLISTAEESVSDSKNGMIKNIVLKVVGSGSTKAIAFENGEIDPDNSFIYTIEQTNQFDYKQELLI